MSDLLPFIVIGVASGSIYALSGLGLVLTYKTSGIFNFAHGAVAAIGAYAFYDLHHQAGLAWPVALIVCVALVGPLLGLGMELLARHLSAVDETLRVVATVGLLLAIQALAAVRYGPAALRLPDFLPTTTFALLGTRVGYNQLIVAVIAAGAAVGLALLFRWTRLGVAMRGVVDDPTLLAITGIGPTRVRRSAWAIGSSFAVLSGILIAPSLGLEPILLTLLIVQAFGAAAVGRFASLPLTYVGGIIVGVGGEVSKKYVGQFPILGGLATSFPFIVLLLVLVFAKRGSLAAAGARATRFIVDRPPLFRARDRLAGWGFTLGLLVFVPAFIGSRQALATAAVATAIIFISIGFLLRTAGQITLCHAAFAALGATSFSHLAGSNGAPWPVALLLAGAATVPLGALVAIPAIRLSGIYLAVATFGLSILMQRMLYPTFLMFGSGGYREIPRPQLGLLDLTSDKAFYYVALAALVAVAALIFLLERGRIGRLLNSLADSPVGLSTLGLPINATRVIVFCISAFVAGVGGAILGASTTAVQAFAGFGPFDSLTWLVVVAIAGLSTLRAAVIGAGLLVMAPAYLPSSWTQYQGLVFGIAAIAIAILATRPIDLAGRIQASMTDSVRASDRSPVRERSADPQWAGAMADKARRQPFVTSPGGVG